MSAQQNLSDSGGHLEVTQKMPTFVPETNKTGRIDCGWYFDLNRKVARPIGFANHHLTVPKTAQFSGAIYETICDWLEKRVDNAPIL